MMRYDRKIYFGICWVWLGTALNICYFCGILESYWSGMGGGLIAVGVLQIARQIKYRTNESYREKVDIELEDERNRYIANKAWAWSGYLFVMIMAVSSIIFKIAGYEELMKMAAGSVCLILVLYWCSYMWLRRKY